MDKLDIASKVTAFVFASGASFVAKNVIANNLDDPDDLKQKVQIIGGSAVIGAMVGKQAKIYVTDTIKNGIEQYQEMQAKIEAKKAESQEASA